MEYLTDTHSYYTHTLYSTQLEYNGPTKNPNFSINPQFILQEVKICQRQLADFFLYTAHSIHQYTPRPIEPMYSAIGARHSVPPCLLLNKQFRLCCLEINSISAFRCRRACNTRGSNCHDLYGKHIHIQFSSDSQSQNKMT